jgi:hypothetical protein
MTSGSSRSALRRPVLEAVHVAADLALVDHRELVLVEELDGSSIVRMCTGRVSLIRSIIAASVVLLPEPVGPTTRTRPYGFCSRSGTRSGAELLERADPVRHDAQGDGERAALHEDVDAEAADRRDPNERST